MNQLTLQQRIATGIFPRCPVDRLMADRVMRCERLNVYGLQSNYCPDCREKGYDKTCELFLDYLGKQIVMESK